MNEILCRNKISILNFSIYRFVVVKIIYVLIEVNKSGNSHNFNYSFHEFMRNDTCELQLKQTNYVFNIFQCKNKKLWAC